MPVLIQALAETAVEALVNFDGVSPTRNRTFPVDLVLRASCGCAPVPAASVAVPAASVAVPIR
ncbi:hypothetical protein [Arthrobacter sp. ov118]|uniref:hypothetical protein n=1 Tax=Arthrobacter sp. ov118 TaxID=1761747 RepID=UPI0015A5F5BC|nr:hypothetical protein [Arthrobacter sp. ov118]